MISNQEPASPAGVKSVCELLLDGLAWSQMKEIEMVGITQLSEYHRAYRAALDLHRLWDESDDRALTELYERLISRLKPLMDSVGGEWSRKADLIRHLGFIKRNLELSDRSLSAGDARDIVFFDMPAFADHLLSQAAQ
ncbi:hypothetical protein AB7M29_004400 [Pseudomonas sp. F-14 TE3623]